MPFNELIGIYCVKLIGIYCVNYLWVTYRLLSLATEVYRTADLTMQGLKIGLRQ